MVTTMRTMTVKHIFVMIYHVVINIQAILSIAPVNVRYAGEFLNDRIRIDIFMVPRVS